MYINCIITNWFFSPVPTAQNNFIRSMCAHCVVARLPASVCAYKVHTVFPFLSAVDRHCLMLCTFAPATMRRIFSIPSRENVWWPWAAYCCSCTAHTGTSQSLILNFSKNAVHFSAPFMESARLIGGKIIFLLSMLPAPPVWTMDFCRFSKLTVRVCDFFLLPTQPSKLMVCPPPLTQAEAGRAWEIEFH